MTDLASLVVRLQADNSSYLKALEQATNKLKQHVDDSNALFDQLKDGLGDIAGDIAAAFTIDKIIEFSEAAIEAQASVAKMSQETGISVEKMQTMNLAFAEAGLSGDQTAMAMKKLGQAVSEAAGDPTSKAAIAFRLLGVNVKDSQGNIRDLNDIMASMADRYSKLEDGANKTAIGQALMGRGAQAMTPFLNAGSQALADVESAANKAGAALSGEAAEAAETLERKLNLLKAVAVAGLQNAIAAELIPTLNALADAWNTGGGSAEAYAEIAQGIGTVMRGVAYVVLEFMGGFSELGNLIGATAAAAVAAAHGNFAEAASIFQELEATNTATIAKYNAMQEALYADNADKKIAEAKRGAEGAEGSGAGDKEKLGNLAAAEKTQEADKALEHFAGTLKEQAQSYNLGEEASVRFKLATGALGDAMKVASDAGRRAAAEAIRYAEALQQKKDIAGGDKLIAQLVEQGDTLDKSAKAAFTYKINTGELGASLDRLAKSGHDLRPALEAAFDRNLVIKDQEAIQKVNDQLDVMNGKLVQAAQHQFDQQNKGLRDNLNATGNTQGAAQVDKLEAANAAMARQAELEQQATVIEEKYGQAIAQVNLLRAQGSITSLQAQQQINNIQQQEIGDLAQVNSGMSQLAAQNPNLVKLAQSAQQFNTQLIALKTSAVDPLTTDVRNNMESAFADTFSKLLEGTESLKNAIKGFLMDIEKMFIQMVAKNYAQQLFGAGGAAGGAPGFLAGLIGGSGGAAAAGSAGGFASGGTISSNKVAMVGENGPELIYSGASNLKVQPIQKNSVSVTNHFVVQSANGTISRSSQSQMAAEAARQMSIANRRNN